MPPNEPDEHEAEPCDITDQPGVDRLRIVDIGDPERDEGDAADDDLGKEQVRDETDQQRPGE